MKEERTHKLLPFRRIRGAFPSLKNNRSIHFGTKLEGDYLYHLEIDKDVLSYQPQPGIVEYFWGGVHRTHSPHYLVSRPYRQQLITIKPNRFYQTEEEFSRFRAIREVCVRLGYEHIVITESTIREEPRLTNIKILWRYARTPVPIKFRIAAQELFEDRSLVNIDELCEHLISNGADKESVRQIIYSLIFQKVFVIDWEEPLSGESYIHCIERGAW